MAAIVGLGNPGSQYEWTRHNAGFRAIDLLAQRLVPFGSQSASSTAAIWKQHSGSLVFRTKLNFTCAIGEVPDSNVVLIKPHTFMNRSGEALQAVLRFFQIPVAETAVIFDDLDLEPGVLRVRVGGSAGGHNGVSDIIQHCGADFVRIRVGIGHPRKLFGPEHTDVSSFVLGTPKGEELAGFNESVVRAAEVAETWLREGIAKAQAESLKRP